MQTTQNVNILEDLAAIGIEFQNGEAVLTNRKFQKISAFDVLSGPLANQLQSCTTNEEAVQFVWDTLDHLDSIFHGTYQNEKGVMADHPQYNHIGPKTRTKMALEMRGKSPLQILFYITNSSLKGAGLGKIA